MFGRSLRSTTATLAWTLLAFSAAPIAAQQFPLVSVTHTQNNPNAVGNSTSRLVVLLPPVGYGEDGSAFLTSKHPGSFEPPPAIFLEPFTTKLPKLAVPDNDTTPALITEDDSGQHFCPEDCDCHTQQHTWQFLPDGLLYRSYLAGEKEPRFAAVWLNESGRGWIWETALGGRVGLVRYGTEDSARPQGWQLDIEGAVFARLDLEVESNLEAADFRAGIVSTWRDGPTAIKFGYYHLSSHLGDEFLIANPGFDRLNYVRDSILAGITYEVTQSALVYGEVAVAPWPSGGAEPWEFQFGAEYNPMLNRNRCRSPFAAVNAHLRQEFDFGGSLNILAGWQWQSDVSTRLLRVGVQYYNGKSMQYSFFDKDEELLGMGLWLDY